MRFIDQSKFYHWEGRPIDQIQTVWKGLSIEWLSEAKQAINLSRANGQTAISLFYLPIALPYSAGLNAHVYEVLTIVY